MKKLLLILSLIKFWSYPKFTKIINKVSRRDLRLWEQKVFARRFLIESKLSKHNKQ